MPKITRHASSNAVGTTGFTNPGNAYASDDSYATAAPGTNSTISSYFGGFNFSSYIPSGSQIHSVVVGIERKMSTTASTASTTARAYDDTTALETEQTSTAEPTSDTVWGHTLASAPTYAQITSANFKVLVGAKRGAGATGYTFSLDDVYVTVDYTPPPSAPIVQVKRAITNGIDSTTLSFDTLPTVGNTIIVVPASYAGNLASTIVTDNQSHGSYRQHGLIEADSGTDNGDLCQYEMVVANSSGTFTITINPGGSSADVTWLIVEVEGRAASPYDTAVTAQAPTTGTAASTGNITPSENNCLLFGAVSHTGSDTTITEGSGWTLIDEIEGGSSFMPLSVIYKLQTTATAEAATWTLGASVEWICCVVSYKASAASEISGTASITLGEMTNAATGTVDVAGTASITLAGMTSTAAGTVDVAGSAGITLGEMSSSGAGTVDVAGAASIQLDAMTCAAEGTVGSAPIYGEAAITLDAMTCTGSGSVEVNGSSSITLESMTCAAAGAVEVQGTADINLGEMTAAGTGTVEVSGSASIFLDSMTCAADGTVSISGAADITLGEMTCSADGVVGYVPVSGSADITLDGLSCSAAGAVDIAGSAGITLGEMTLSAEGLVEYNLISGEAEIQLDGMTCQGAGSVEITGVLNAGLDDMAILAEGSVLISGSLDATLGEMVVDATGSVYISSPISLTLPTQIITLTFESSSSVLTFPSQTERLTMEQSTGMLTMPDRTEILTFEEEP